MQKKFSLNYFIEIDNNKGWSSKISFLKRKRIFLEINPKNLQAETLWTDFCTYRFSRNSSLEFITIDSFDDHKLNPLNIFFNKNYILQKNKKIMAVAEFIETTLSDENPQCIYFDLYVHEHLSEYELCCFLEFVFPKTFGTNFYKVRDEIISDVFGQGYGLKEYLE